MVGMTEFEAVGVGLDQMNMGEIGLVDLGLLA